MAVLKIGSTSTNGVDMPSPSDLMVTIMDLSDAERVANGSISIKRIATKRKLEISYQYLSRTDMATLLQAISATTFYVTYPDPQSNTLQVKQMYVGDRTVSFLDYTNNVPRYKDIKFNFIEV